jgi:ferredoxin
MFTPVINISLCVSCESCALICPEVFDMKDDKAIVISNSNKDNIDSCRIAIENCPTSAISCV